MFHRGRVQLDDLNGVLDEAGHQRPVIVPGGLDADPAQHRRPICNCNGSAVRQHADTRAGHPEPERGSHDLAAEVGHHRHRFGLADIDRHQQHPGRVETADPAHEPGLTGASNELDSHPRTSLIDENPPSPTTTTSSPIRDCAFYQRARND